MATLHIAITCITIITTMIIVENTVANIGTTIENLTVGIIGIGITIIVAIGGTNL